MTPLEKFVHCQSAVRLLKAVKKVCYDGDIPWECEEQLQSLIRRKCYYQHQAETRKTND